MISDGNYVSYHEHKNDNRDRDEGIEMNQLVDAAIKIDQQSNPGIEEEAVAHVQEENSEDEPELAWKYFYVFLFAFTSITEGFLIGYNISLSSIFTEQKVPSEKRALLNVILSAYILRMFVAPITDKYYMPGVGRRKTYLLPCKLILAAVYACASLYMDAWVQSSDVWSIAGVFLVISAVSLFEGNSMLGFRLDVFGNKEGGAAASSAALGFLFGITLGLQIFTGLNSAYICEKVFGAKEAIISHQGMLLLIAIVSFCSFLIILNMKEREVPAARSASTNPLHVIKSIFKVETLKKALVWNFIGPTFAFGMKMVSGQYYIKAGFRREDYIITVALITIPAHLLSNIIWIRIIKGGRLMFLFWVAALNAVILEFVHSLNCGNFDKDDNYNFTLAMICIISCLEVFANWHMAQQSFFLASAPKHYTLTYIQTVNSAMIAVRSMPL